MPRLLVRTFFGRWGFKPVIFKGALALWRADLALVLDDFLKGLAS